MLNNIVIAGGGVLGSQIAYQCGFYGKHVVVYDISEDAIKAAEKRVNSWDQDYRDDVSATEDQIKAAHANISYNSDLAEAVKDADLVIEAIPEVVDIKKDFYHRLAAVLNPQAIIVSNSSTLLPSQFAEDTGRPDKFMALHFANHIWIENLTEMMPTKETSEATIDSVRAFAESIGMVPTLVKKEQPGYLLNSLLVPWITSAEALWGNDIGSIQDIDRSWMIAKEAKYGPFGNIDRVGLRTAYNIGKETLPSLTNEKEHKGLEIALERMDKMISEGKLGMESGEGFYQYPNPAYEAADFLKHGDR
ncbi:3-hydroxyacyl-CoA dehydrogenase [Weissella viridescens]|nr:3-hydroxyacyl-CoA dehydrogenase [Weissella viridescens]